MKFKHTTLIFFSGCIWFLIGAFLLMLGLNLILEAIKFPTADSAPLLSILTPYVGGVEQVAVVLIALGLLVGFFKGRFVLGKSAQRIARRILQFPEPMPVLYLYSPPYYLLIAGMMLLGMSIKFLGIPLDIRGIIDIAVGSALINGALILFKMAGAVKSSKSDLQQQI